MKKRYSVSQISALDANLPRDEFARDLAQKCRASTQAGPSACQDRGVARKPFQSRRPDCVEELRRGIPKRWPWHSQDQTLLSRSAAGLRRLREQTHRLWLTRYKAQQDDGRRASRSYTALAKSKSISVSASRSKSIAEQAIDKCEKFAPSVLKKA